MANYSKFYMLMGLMVYEGDREELKESLVSQFTGGRTSHLHEMERKEYEALCAHLDTVTNYSRTMRRKRSLCLHLMQRLKIDTADWNRVNLFCQDARIAGKPFARIGIDELDALAVKLRSIENKGGLRRAWDGDNGATDGLQYMLVGGNQLAN